MKKRRVFSRDFKINDVELMHLVPIYLKYDILMESPPTWIFNFSPSKGSYIEVTPYILSNPIGN